MNDQIIRDSFIEILHQYHIERLNPFKGNKLAKKIRIDLPILIKKSIGNDDRYKVDGSAGKGQWADCPWIAVFDSIVTTSAQSGYYPVYLFKADMSGFYLSLNQGVTEVMNDYKRDAKKILEVRSANYRAKLDYDESEFTTKTQMNSNRSNARLYEAGSILSKYYPLNDIPDNDTLINDIFVFLGLYNQLINRETEIDESFDNIDFERKQLRLHFRIERRSTLANKVKKCKGYKCEACEFEFVTKYGDIGLDFIEAHHLTPISKLDIGSIKIDLQNDFAVLCSNCHRMIHKLNDPSDLVQLRKLITKMRAE